MGLKFVWSETGGENFVSSLIEIVAAALVEVRCGGNGFSGPPQSLENFN